MGQEADVRGDIAQCLLLAGQRRRSAGSIRPLAACRARESGRLQLRCSAKNGDQRIAWPLLSVSRTFSLLPPAALARSIGKVGERVYSATLRRLLATFDRINIPSQAN